MTDIDLWVDPACPWAWITSRWLLEVERLRPVTVRFHVMSLAVLNGREPDDGLWGPVRVLVHGVQRYGPGVVRPLYGAMGTRIHIGREGHGPEMISAALADVGLDPRLAEAATSAGYDDELRRSHDAGMALVGQEVGTPVVHIPNAAGPPIAFFGPVVTPIPRGEAAARLWDGILLVTGTDGFFELKRTRDRKPSFD
ncbi:MAG: disulfide bond formation protein DsbA [Micromonosporaceae bacterium]